MGHLVTFNFITLNGYFKGLKEDIGWHRHGVQENEFARESLKAGSTLLFGRITYEMMAGYWPSSMAQKDSPQLALLMNNADKIVFSKTLKKAEWNNTHIIAGDIFNEIGKIKRMAGINMTILGSGSIVTQFSEHGLIDEYQIMIDPVVLGNGTPIFKGIEGKLDLELVGTKVFNSGVVLLSYKPLVKP